MFKAVKECLKNWLIQHERLYWYIVVGIAVFFFGLITAIGCGKLVDANASIGGVAPELYEIDFGEYQERCEEMIENYEYFAIYEGCFEVGKRHYYYNFCTEAQTRETSSSTLSANCYFIVEVGTNKVVHVAVFVPDACGPYSVKINSGDKVFIGSNFAITGLSNSGNIEYPSFTPEYTYSPTAPYIGFDSLTIKNKLGTADIDYGLLGGTDLAQNTVSLDWLYEQGMDMSFWQYNGHVHNLIGFSPEGMQLHMAFTVELPTNEFITAYINKYNNGAKIDYREAMKNVIDSVADWLINDGPTKTYEIKYVFEPVVNADGTFSVSLTFQELYDLLCYHNEDFLRLYGLSTNENMSPYVRAILMSHLHIEQTNSLLYVPLNGTMWYGNPIINFYSRGIVNKAVTAKVEVDIRTATEEEISEAMKKAIEKGYDEALKDANDALGDAESELEGIYGIDGAFGELEGSDLWSGFKGLVTGFTGSIPAIQSLSLLIGSVFAFLPMQVSGIMSFTLLALCIIGIYKAIRG